MMNVTCRKQVESLISVFFQTYQHCMLYPSSVLITNLSISQLPIFFSYFSDLTACNTASLIWLLLFRQSTFVSPLHGDVSI